jgi:hypothetical protein
MFLVNYSVKSCQCFVSNILQEWNAPKPMHPSLLNEALQWATVSASLSDETYHCYG